MSTYVVSDIHGEYDAFMEILDKIHFSDQDILYVMGDGLTIIIPNLIAWVVV